MPGACPGFIQGGGGIITCSTNVAMSKHHKRLNNGHTNVIKSLPLEPSGLCIEVIRGIIRGTPSPRCDILLPLGGIYSFP